MTDISNDPSKPYTTHTELEFINGLGAFSDNHDVGRFELLKRYKNACDKRAYWSGIDNTVTMAHLDQLSRD